jgi:hypothetical protein
MQKLVVCSARVNFHFAFYIPTSSALWLGTWSSDCSGHKGLHERHSCECVAIFQVMCRFVVARRALNGGLSQRGLSRVIQNSWAATHTNYCFHRFDSFRWLGCYSWNWYLELSKGIPLSTNSLWNAIYIIVNWKKINCKQNKKKDFNSYQILYFSGTLFVSFFRRHWIIMMISYFNKTTPANPTYAIVPE